MHSVAERIRTEVGTLHVLINNAGIVRSGYFWEHDAARGIQVGHDWLERFAAARADQGER